MKILARGQKIKTDELKLKLSSVDCDLKVMDNNLKLPANLIDFNLIFDLDFDEFPERIMEYNKYNGHLIVSSVKIQLAGILGNMKGMPEFKLTGMNCIPTFIQRDIAELSVYESNNQVELASVMNNLNWEYKLVEDRVGMVTPRIVFMIINEAYYTMQEGTASKQDIDVSMKLGTNYPFGPFEWADRIGIKDVYETLEAVYHDTHDERYKICPLLKTKYLNRNLPV